MRTVRKLCETQTWRGKGRGLCTTVNSRKVVALFPGQGSQFVGMGQEIASVFPEAKNVFAKVDSALGEPLCEDIMFNGPEKTLNETENAQPAILAFSMAVVEILTTRKKIFFGRDAGQSQSQVVMAMGHSLGEFTAMAACGMMDIGEAARLVRTRGRAMQLACDEFYNGSEHTYEMVALMPTSLEAAQVACSKAKEEMRTLGSLNVCQVANQNGQTQIVISGTKAVVGRAVAILKKENKVRGVPLRVSAPFHSSVMEGAKNSLAQAMTEINLTDPSVPIVSNVSAELETGSKILEELAVDQLVSPVRWVDCVDSCWNHVYEDPNTQFIEFGGKVLTPLTRKILNHVPEENFISLSSVEDIEKFLVKN